MNKAYRDFAPSIIKSQGGTSLSATDYHHYKEAKLRVYIIVLCFILCYLIGMLRVISLSLSDYKPRDYASTYNKNLIEHRANITDRNGNLLATSLKIPSVYADPAKIIDLDEAVYKLHSVLKDIPLSALREKLKNPKRRFVWIKRKITPEVQYKINKLGIPGVFFKEEEKRFYPQGHYMSQFLGFTDVDNIGISGVEKSLNEQIKDSYEDLELSIDTRVQNILTKELKYAIDRFSAIGGAGIVMNIQSGEILGISSLPDFNPTNIKKASKDQKFNRATLGIYELGSIFKIINNALALENGITMEDTFDVGQPLKIGRFRIKDYHQEKKGTKFNLSEILRESSNIGSARIIDQLGVEKQRDFFRKLGLLDKVDIEIPEVGSTITPYKWRLANAMTMSYGHGIAVSPLSATTAIASILNDGLEVKPTLLKGKKVEYKNRVVSKKTSNLIKKMMRIVVREGTGSQAESKGYFIGGKTGTADKLDENGGYKGKEVISSFIGAFPMNKPQYIIYIMVDEPQGRKDTWGFATGGWVAAPAVKKVIEQIAPILGIFPENNEFDIANIEKNLIIE
ncbi:MAG: penicillin-binding protein 2 [Alphaproteobacteria bacterium]|jgi:cell division protein FtsI (penicillin-binding protein 3)|nr:penicillin-binding protein 2 [Alphaproteobacteria bacterium]